MGLPAALRLFFVIYRGVYWHWGHLLQGRSPKALGWASGNPQPHGDAGEWGRMGDLRLGDEAAKPPHNTPNPPSVLNHTSSDRKWLILVGGLKVSTGSPH